MAFEMEQREARRLLDGVELGSLSVPDMARLIEAAEPTWIYLMFTWLRTRYAKHAAAEGVLGRMLELSKNYPFIATMMREGQADSLTQWFEENYDYTQLDADSFVELVVEKLES